MVTLVSESCGHLFKWKRCRVEMFAASFSNNSDIKVSVISCRYSCRLLVLAFAFASHLPKASGPGYVFLLKFGIDLPFPQSLIQRWICCMLPPYFDTGNINLTQSTSSNLATSCQSYKSNIPQVSTRYKVPVWQTPIERKAAGEVSGTQLFPRGFGGVLDF